MSVAILLQSDPQVDGFTRQFAIFPSHEGDNTPVIHTRLTNGVKGRANKWEKANSLSDVTVTVPSTEKVTKVSVISLTDGNIEDMMFGEWSQSVANRLLGAEGTDASGLPWTFAKQAITDLYTMLANSDSDLERYLDDGATVYHPVSANLPDIIPPQPEPYEVPEATATSTLPDANAKTVRTGNSRDSLIPPVAFAKSYVHREVYGVADFDIFDAAYGARQNVLIYGPTGPGKTTSVKAWAAQHRMPFVRVQGNGALDPVGLFGREVLNADGTVEWVDGMVTDVVRNGGVLDLDEINFFPPKISTVLFPLLDGDRTIRLIDNHGEVIPAHPDLMIFATMNPDYAGTSDLNAALRNRFAVQLQWGYDERVERRLGIKPSVLKLAKSLRSKDADEIFTPTPTNALLEFQKFAAVLGTRWAIENFVARYSDEEQSAVRVVFKAEEANLDAECGPKPEQTVGQTGSRGGMKITKG